MKQRFFAGSWPTLLDNHRMGLDTIGEVIAIRQLCLADDPSREILVKIGKPQLSEHNDYFCPIQRTPIRDDAATNSFGSWLMLRCCITPANAPSNPTAIASVKGNRGWIIQKPETTDNR